MRRRRYPSGSRKERIDKLLEYIRSNPACRRQNIQAYMDSIYSSTLTPKTISEYLDDLLYSGIIKEKNGQFFITAKEQERKE